MKGFTLIELLLVIAAISILAGIVAVAISGSPEGPGVANKDKEEEYCKRIGLHYSFEQLPVACVKYYK